MFYLRLLALRTSRVCPGVSRAACAHTLRNSDGRITCAEWLPRIFLDSTSASRLERVYQSVSWLQGWLFDSHSFISDTKKVCSRHEKCMLMYVTCIFFFFLATCTCVCSVYVCMTRIYMSRVNTRLTWFVQEWIKFTCMSFWKFLSFSHLLLHLLPVCIIPVFLHTIMETMTL